MRMHSLAAGSLCPLSHRERVGVRGCVLSMGFEPPHPNPLPNGEREHTASVVRASANIHYRSFIS
jgi:hypothetical protein